MSSCSLSVTVDIEDWYHIPSVTGSSFSVYRNTDEFYNKWNRRFDYLTGPTKRVLELLDSFEITATFFIVADVIVHYPGLVESIIEHGHELGCHGLYHRCKIDSKTKQPLVDADEFKKMTVKAKKMIEKVYGKKIIGYRAPSAYIGGWMIDILEDIGFKYDSSISVNSLFNKTDSALKGVSTVPYRPKKGGLDANGDRPFIEFPLPYLKMGLKLPTSGGPLLRFFGADLIRKGLEQSMKRGHTVFYFHSIDLSDEKFPNIGKGRPFYWVIKGKVFERRIKYILSHLKDSVELPTLDKVVATYGI